MNWTVGKKLWSSYLAMLLITFVLGVVVYTLFATVHTNVTQLTGHSLQAVEASGSVERAVLATIMHSKDYTLYKTDEIDRQVRNMADSVLGHLDTMDQLALKYNNTTLAEDSKKARKAISEWCGLYDQTVQAVGDN